MTRKKSDRNKELIRLGALIIAGIMVFSAALAIIIK